MSDRAHRKKSFGIPPEAVPSSVPADYVEPPAANAAIEPCAFCVEQPSGSAGHSGLAQQVHKIPSSSRSYVRLACVFCGAGWVRRRVNARTFEWLRIAS
ncbi:MAG: hypothetical protein ACXWBL_13075 [Usitatibacter sp.]